MPGPRDEALPTKEPRAPVTPDASQLALQRTILAVERTLLAWVRSAISMIAFGFSIYKFFEYLRESEGLVRPHAPRNLGLTLIALGTLTLVAAVFQHRNALQRVGLGVAQAHSTMAVTIALVLALLGLVMFVSISFGTGPF